jgi:hypothetical protein
MALWNKFDTQKAAPKFLEVGQVQAVNVTSGGTGYADGATVTFGAPAGGGVQATGTISVVGGVITGVNLTNPGAGYTSAPTATAPVGTGGVLTTFVSPNNVSNTEIVFVSVEEAGLAVNRVKGIKTPGWNRVTSKVTSTGEIRYSVEPIVAVTAESARDANAGDAKGDDLVVGDINIAVTTQPAATSVTAPTAAVFTVVASGASLTYQWQVRLAAGTTYANVSGGTGATTASYTTAATVVGDSGDFYRCVVSNSAATAQVTSKGAKLTVAA